MKHFLFLAALSLMCACSFHETEHLEQNHSSTFEQELKMFYDKQNSMWNKFVIHTLTRSSGLNEDLGLDDFMNDETFQQIQEDLLSFCEDHQDILKIEFDSSTEPTDDNTSTDECISFIQNNCSKEFYTTLNNIINREYSTINVDKIIFNKNMTEAERLSIVYMVAVVNSRIDYDIMSEGSQSGCKEDFKRAQKACLLNYLYHCGKAFFHTPIGAAFKIAEATYKYDGCDRESRL